MNSRHFLSVLVALSLFTACPPNPPAGFDGGNDSGITPGDMDSGMPGVDSGTPDAGDDSAADTDGDGLTNGQERDGWDISVDRVGLGNYLVEHCVSNPLLADTDSDGLTDFEEYQKTNPTKTDTDGDQLSDSDELNVYLSVATAVDTDGDSVKNSRSNTQLWDGTEITKWGTSPSLPDTDGDNVSDYDEIIELSRNPLVAQVPSVAIELVGNFDIRLNVEYSQMVGQNVSYGSSYMLETSTEASRTDSDSSTKSIENTTTKAAELDIAKPPSLKVSYSRSTTTGYSREQSAAITSTAAQSATSEYNRALSDARSLTETSSTGQISTGLTIKNDSQVAYTLTNLAVSVLQWQSSTSSFKTLATLQPVLSSFTLAGGDSRTVPQQVQATGVDATLVREFLSEPHRLYFAVSNFDMTNAEGLNFAFLKDTTNARTGHLIIDYGDGTVEDYHVATNVRRNHDGSLAGVPVKTVFDTYLKIPFASEPWIPEADAGIDAGVYGDRVGKTVLTKVRTTETALVPQGVQGFWALFSDAADIRGTYKNFEDTVLQRGETLTLAYIRDRDLDGVFDREEAFYGTSDMMADSDGDGLTDFQEIRTGWIAGAGIIPTSTTYPKLVRPSALKTDTDGDGLSDLAERNARTDPRNPDTDGDKVPDGVDAAPLDATNLPPVIALVASAANDPVVRVTGTVNDPADIVRDVVINWGDQLSTTLTFAGSDGGVLDAGIVYADGGLSDGGVASGIVINQTHLYLSTGPHTITVTARDTRSASSMVTLMATTAIVPDYANYRFEGNFFDSASGMHHATVTQGSSAGMGFTTDRFNSSLGAFQFKNDFQNQSYSYATVSNLGMIDLNNFTVAAWVLGSGGKYMVTQHGRFALRIIQQHLALELGVGDTTPVQTTGTITGSGWNHLVATKSGDAVTFYVNGVVAGSATRAVSNTYSCSGLYFNGTTNSTSCQPNPDPQNNSNTFAQFTMDDVHIFNRALSASDVQSVYLERGYVP